MKKMMNILSTHLRVLGILLALLSKEATAAASEEDRLADSFQEKVRLKKPPIDMAADELFHEILARCSLDEGIYKTLWEHCHFVASENKETLSLKQRHLVTVVSDLFLHSLPDARESTPPHVLSGILIFCTRPGTNLTAIASLDFFKDATKTPAQKLDLLRGMRNAKKI